VCGANILSRAGTLLDVVYYERLCDVKDGIELTVENVWQSPSPPPRWIQSVVCCSVLQCVAVCG